MPTFGTAPLIDLGDKVVTDINAATWTPSGGSPLSFTAKRVFMPPEYEPTDTNLYVDVVVAQDEDEELADRGGVSQRSFIVGIFVQQVLADKTSKAAVDALVNFAYALAMLYELRVEFVVSGTQRSKCIRREIPVIYSPQEFDTNGRFFGGVKLTFEGWYR